MESYLRGSKRSTASITAKVLLILLTNLTIDFELIEASSTSPIVISDTASSTDVTVAATFNGKTTRDQFYSNIKTTDEKNSWEATCNICKATIRGTKGVTSNYNRHIKECHTSQYEFWQQQLSSCGSIRQKKMTDTVSVQKVKSMGTSSLKYSSNHARQIELEKTIIEDLVIELGLPLSLIERPAFMEFMRHVDPRFSVVSRRTLCRTTLPNLYSKMLDGLRSFCSMATFMSVTLDIWTDRRQRAFFALTGHAIIDAVFRSYVMSFQPIFGNHHAPLLLETYETCVNSFQIQSKLVRLITDSCSSNISAFRGLIIPGFERYFQNEDNELSMDSNSEDEGSETDSNTNENNIPTDIQDVLNGFLNSVATGNESFRLPCYAHTLQLIVNDGLKGLTSIRNSLEKISKIAKLSHSSTLVSERFEKIEVCIPKANKTRWNSQYQTVVTVISIPPSDLNDILTQTQHRELCLKSLDYQMLNEFVLLLTLFAEATITTQAQNTPSISIVAPSILAIYHDLLLERTNVKHASNLCESLLESLLSRFGGLLEQMMIVVDIPENKKNKRFYDLYKDPIFLMAPFLDGRFRLQWILTPALSEDVQQELSIKIQQLVLEQCFVLDHANMQTAISSNDNPVLSPSAQTPTSITNVTSSPGTPKRKTLFTNISKNVKKVRSDPLSYIKDEILKYLNEDDMDSMLLMKSQKNYPALSKLALKVLSTPATSAPVERVFSQSGFLFRQHRASMTRTTLQQLTMLKCNRDLL